MNRIAKLLEQKDKNILSVYFTAGCPVLDSTGKIIRALEARGVDMIEVGVPFSDPMADGIVIQQSSAQALQNGMTLSLLLQQLEKSRQECEIPLILMGYLNPMIQYGIEALFQKCREIGIDGLIIPDLPFREYMNSFKPLCEAYDVPVIMLITPETAPERVKWIDEHCGGFIYMVSSASTTGIKEHFSTGQWHYFQQIDSLCLKNKKLIGFGISNRETFTMACQYSNGAIVGSLFVKELMARSSVEEAADRFIQQLT